MLSPDPKDVPFGTLVDRNFPFYGIDCKVGAKGNNDNPRLYSDWDTFYCRRSELKA